MIIEDSIVPGKILYLKVSFPHETTENDKYFVIVAIGTSPLLLKINTSGSQSKIAERFKERQFKLRKNDYPFLAYDSYLDCGSVWTTLITIEEIVAQLRTDPSRMKGEILDPHKNEIIRLVKQSKSIENRYKRKIEDALIPKK